MSSKLPAIPKPQGRPESKIRMNELLDKNHRNYDVVYVGYKANHIPHAIPSLYGLGATPAQIQKFYDYFSERLEPIKEAVLTINEGNWETHIGTANSYSAYLPFFEKELETQDIYTVFKKYVPRLIPGLTSSALHPLIHLGYALEFESKQILAEAIAFACMEYTPVGEMIDSLDKTKIDPTKRARDLVKSLDALNPTLHLEDKRFLEKVAEVGPRFGSQIKDLLSNWDFDHTNSDLIVQKTLDLTVSSVLAFCNSYQESAPDFFYAHVLTGNHAIRTILPHLEPKDQRRLLQIGFLSLVVMYLVRGPVEFNENYQYRPKTTNPDNIPTENLDWQALFDIINDCRDDHTIKVVRTLDVIQKTIVRMEGSNYPSNLNLEGTRMVVATVGHEDDWYV